MMTFMRGYAIISYDGSLVKREIFGINVSKGSQVLGFDGFRKVGNFFLSCYFDNKQLFWCQNSS
jgi:hypothetical protein